MACIFRDRLRRGLAVSILLACAALSIPAPHRVLLVIDTNFQESVTIGNYYRAQRGIPETNVVYIGVRDVDRFNNYYASGSFVNFSNDILVPILTAIDGRGLSNTIDYIVLSYGIPVRVRYPSATVDHSVASYLSSYLSCSNHNQSWYSGPSFATATNGFFSCTNLFPGNKRYRLATHLYGYRIDEVKRGIDQSIRGDGAYSAAAPYGKWILQIGPYSVLNSGDAWPLAQTWAATRSLDSMWTNGSYNFKTANITNTLVFLGGGTYSGYNYFNYSNYHPTNMALPGSYVEAHESYGLLPDHFFETRAQQQFPMPLYLRMGFATMSGAVTEPYLGFMQASSDTNYSERFRWMYMRGYTSLEAAYFGSWRDERGPTTFMGDPLCRPFARIPAVAFAAPLDGAIVNGAVTVTVNASVTGSDGVGRVELYLDDSPIPVCTNNSGSLGFTWDSSLVPDGTHTLYAVAYENNAVRSPGWKRITVTSTNNARSVAITSPAAGATYNDSDLAVTVSATGAYDQVRLLIGGVVKATSAAAGVITILKSSMVAGDSQPIVAQLLQGGSIVCTSAPVPVNFDRSLKILSIMTTNSGTNIATSNFYTNLDYQFQTAVLRIRATNVYPGAALYVDGLAAESVVFEPLSGDSDVADLAFRIPTLPSAGVKNVVLSNLNGTTASTNLLAYVPVATSIKLSPASLMVYPGEKLRLDARILDQHSNWMPASTAVSWNTVNGGSIVGGLYVAGSNKGDYPCTVTVGSLTTNFNIGIHEGKTNYFDSFDTTNVWVPMNNTYPWSAGSNEIVANGGGTESFVYLNRAGSHRGKFAGIVQFEGMLMNNNAAAFFGARVLGELWPSSAYPWRRGWGYGIGIFPGEARQHYQNINSTSGTYTSVTKAFATNVWYTVRMAYDEKSFAVGVYSNGTKVHETNQYFLNGPVYTNFIRLAGTYASRFRNFKIMDWNGADLAPVSPVALVASNATTNSIDLAWRDLSGDETGFNIWRSLSNSNYTLVSTTAAGATAYTDASLAPDTRYYFRVTATNASGESLFDGPVILRTKAATAPGAPTGLAAAVTTGTVTLTWTDGATNESGFRVERSTNGVTWSNVGTTGVNGNTFDVYSLPDGSSFFRVCATNSAGDSAYAGPLAVSHPTVAAPSAFAAVVSGTNRITLTWTDNATNELGFIIYRDWTEIATNGPNTTTFIDTGLSTNVTYWYYVQSYNDFDAKSSSFLNRKIIPVFPAVPTNLLPTDPTPTSVRLSWTDPASNAGGFRVQRSPDGVSWGAPSVVNGTNVFDDVGLTQGSLYYYRVQATNIFGDSAWSPSTNIRPDSHAVPLAPSGLAAALSLATVTLSWTDGATNESGFRVERSTNGLTWSNVAAVVSNSNAAAIASLPDGSSYFRVCATNAAGDSPWAGPILVSHLMVAAPTNFTATVAGTNRIALCWSDPATNEMGFIIYRNLSPIATNAPNLTNFTDTGLATNTPYAYYVRAYNLFDAKDSATLNPIIQPILPAVPTNFSAAEASPVSVRLGWGDGGSNTGGFRLHRTLDGSNWSSLALVAGTNIWVDDQAVIGSWAWYRVAATNQFGDSAWTAPVSNLLQRRLVLSEGGATPLPLENRLVFRYQWTGKNFAEPAGMAYQISTHRSGKWTQISNLDAFAVATNGKWTNAWTIPTGYDTARAVDVRLVATFAGGEISAPLILSNIDLSVFFQAASDLTRAAAVNNPWRGEGDGIAFVNLTGHTAVKIFTISGKLVADLKAPVDGSGRVVWSLGGARSPGPGIYLAILHDPAVPKKMLRVMVLP
ncbi:MAG: fibronectin type III domain-containing protein [Spirochaetes bacterium]|nr:fibronectin type III domain-containing protein [Spirochaetota bacterium]